MATNPESSLTAPEDRDRQNRWLPNTNTTPLSEFETNTAMSELNNKDFVQNFPRVDRAFHDPAIPMQNYGLISFVPAKGATANENGVYGFAKLRGNYNMVEEADSRAEYLIRNCDSYHSIFHTYVGRPFPITVSSKYSADTKEIDIKKEMASSMSAAVKDKVDEEAKAMNEIKNREKKMLEESAKAKEDDGTGPVDVDPYEQYITLQVKKAQLSWTFVEHIKKAKEITDIIHRTRAELKQLDEEHPDYSGKYMDKYMDARKEAGLDKQDPKDLEDNFMRYMLSDVKLPTIDDDQVLPVVGDISVCEVVTYKKSGADGE